MKSKGWHLIGLAVIVFFLNFLTLGNREVIDNQITNQIAFVLPLLCVLVFLFGVIKTLYAFFSKNKEAKKINREREEEQGLKHVSAENIKKPKEKKKWQPVNIMMGLLMIGFIVYFNRSSKGPESVVAYSRCIPAIALILTRKNNIFMLSVLLFFGITIFFLPTADTFIFFVAILYMFFSTILRLFKIKWHIAIGLVAALVIGLGLLWENANIVVPENSLTIIKETDNDISIELVDDTGKISTTFNSNRVISLSGKGLPEGIWYACRIILAREEGRAVYQLDNWPIFKIKKTGDVVQRGIITRWLNLKDVAVRNEFNKDFWLPLTIDDYTLQLVKIERSEGIIVAERNFSIVAYDKEAISKLTAYIMVEGDLNKYYDSYTRKGSEGISVWVHSLKGEVISGTVKRYITNYEGDSDKESSFMESSFSTNINGEPVRLWSFGGNPLPGIYHYEIIIDGNVVFDLKYKV